MPNSISKSSLKPESSHTVDKKHIIREGRDPRSVEGARAHALKSQNSQEGHTVDYPGKAGWHFDCYGFPSDNPRISILSRERSHSAV